MEQWVSLITIGVADVTASAAFYERLGWIRSAAGSDEIAFFDAGGVVLALFGSDALARDAGVASERSGFRGVALAHNVPRREDVDATLAEAVRAGAGLIKPAEQADWGGYSGYFADPDGHLWEVAWNPHFPLDPEGRIKLPG
jgi:uncharacterized protein